MWPSRSENPIAAFVLSTTAGLLILLGALVVLGSNRETTGMVPVAAASGLVTVFAGTLLWIDPKMHGVAGIVIIVASAIALFAYGWVLPSALGVALGIAGGIVAVQWESPAKIQPTSIR